MSITERYCTSTGAGAHDGTSEANAWSLTEAGTNAAAGQRVNVKLGTFTLGANFSPTNSGTVAQPIIWEGYNSTIGDLASVVPDPKTRRIDATNFPLIDGGSSWKVLWNKNYTVIKSMNFQSAGNVTVLDVTGTQVCVQRCKIRSTGTSSSTGGLQLSSDSTAIDCDVETTNAGSVYALSLNSIYARAIGCFIKAATNTYAAVWVSSSGNVLSRNVIIATAKDGVMLRNTADSALIDSNTIYAPSGAGVAIDNIAATGLPVLINNSITDSSKAFDNKNSGTSQRPVIRYANRTRDNAGADNGADDWPEHGRVTTDAGGPETDFGDLTGGTDYGPVAGSALLGAGHVPYLDIGAIQRQAVAGSVGIIG